MSPEKKQEFTRRLTQCNRTGVILIMYEIIFTYLTEAKEAQISGEREAFKHAIRKSQEMLKELEKALDFKYELSKNLYRLYAYCIKELSLAMCKASLDEVENVEKLLQKLFISFQAVEKEDHSKTMMQNTQQIYAGITYGKGNLRDYMENDVSRGFLA